MEYWSVGKRHPVIAHDSSTPVLSPSCRLYEPEANTPIVNQVDSSQLGDPLCYGSKME